ncbi:tetratricopeptide repeat protein [Nocardia arthritidis]|uniref:tetratricopeptide repeat protein n=1 Tax=Nocardia arthritidis TaxID=228602 RepID=UPI0007A41116|nr:tetratricopeptide repeat protein [Nocardia arthritidis]
MVDDPYLVAKDAGALVILTEWPAVEVNPANARAYFLLGESAIAASEYNDAIRYMTEATRLDPSFAPAWRELGVAQSRNGALDIAVDSVRQAVTLDREDAEAHSILGGIYRRKARELARGLP